MNTQLIRPFSQVDGRYLQDSELSSIQDFVTSYEQRTNVYRYLKDHSDTLILKTFRSLMASHRKVIQTHSEICKRDMSLVLRYIAVSILKDDENSFIESLVLWMQNILFALNKEEQSVEFYIALQRIVAQEMTTGEAALVNQYLSTFIDALRVGKS
ncbi:MAG: hypothetical protein AAFR31_11495 [Cyanobacteria bacterium J06627_8]